MHRVPLTACQAAYLADMQASRSVSCWQSERMQDFLTEGIPTRRDERWKYTDVSSIFSTRFVWPDQPKKAYCPNLLEDVYAFVFVNGFFRSDLSQLQGLENQADWQVCSFAASNHSDLLPHVSSLPEYQTPFSTLNDACFSELFFLTIPDKVCLDKPIHLVYMTDAIDCPVMVCPRQHIRIGRYAEAVVFEEYYGEGKMCYLNNSVGHIDVGDGGQVQWYKLQREGRHAFHISDTMIHQKRDSQVTRVNMATGAKLSREDLYFSLEAIGAACDVTALTYAQDRQHMDCHSRVDHRVAHGNSQQRYKSIVTDSANLVFHGQIKVHGQAQKVQASQSNNNLLLSDLAAVYTKPALEIYHDDVQCQHAATIGTLDPNALMYLRARTLDQASAERLLIQAFANEFLEGLPASTIGDRIRAYMISQCPGMEGQEVELT